MNIYGYFENKYQLTIVPSSHPVSQLLLCFVPLWMEERTKSCLEITPRRFYTTPQKAEMCNQYHPDSLGRLNSNSNPFTWAFVQKHRPIIIQNFFSRQKKKLSQKTLIWIPSHKKSPSALSSNFRHSSTLLTLHNIRPKIEMQIGQILHQYNPLKWRLKLINQGAKCKVQK